MFWIGDQGEGTLLSGTLRFSYFRTSFSFSLWLGEWDHFTRRTETFQKISNMYGYFFVHITLHEFSVNSRTWGEGGKMLRSSAQGVDPPQCAASWMLLLHMQETVLWIPRLGLLSSRGGGPDVLAPGLHCQPKSVDPTVQNLQTGWNFWRLACLDWRLGKNLYKSGVVYFSFLCNDWTLQKTSDN